ncbi:MAG: NADH-quinone oxidoreductase subunit H [Candidatus Omnitrophica bacterium]|nr:NADH-quinone oxidoreductase subunit H [Candidatus Omnitrophota bacterium]
MFNAMFSMIIFPGFLFLAALSFLGEFIDRKIYARLQNRVGPPWFQPVADFIKLLGKQEIIPTEANQTMFKMAPLFATASVVTAFFYIPLWTPEAMYSFNGDILVVLYLLTIPTLSFFIGGWYSTSLYARIGTVRSLTQLFAYEVPLFMGILSSALLANTWSLTKITEFYVAHPWLWLMNLGGFIISLIALLGKLEKTPFDIPEAETEIVAGAFTEYSGKLLAFLRLTLNIEMIVGAALLSAVFLPFALTYNPYLDFVIFLIKLLSITFLISLARTVVARLRIDQMVNFCWKYLVPLAMMQLLLNLAVKGVMIK